MSPLPAPSTAVVDRTPPPIYGLIAEFDSPGDLVAAARKTRDAGYRRIDAYSPFPIHEMREAIGMKPTKLPLLVLVGALTGTGTALLMQWFASAVHYPVNVGGRPLASWPMFIPITFELTVLIAAFASFIGVFALCRLPRFHHPLFAAPLFARATTDGFFICIEADDPSFDPTGTLAFLEGLHPTGIEEVPV